MLGHVLFSSVNRGTSFTSTAGSTYVLMNNQTLLRTSYPDLSNYWPEGAYGSTSGVMVIPNIQDLVFRGADIGRGADESASSRTSISGIIPSGLTVGSYQIAALPSHVHISGTVPSGFNGGYPGATPGANWGTNVPQLPLGPATAFTSTNTLFFHPSNVSGVLQSGSLSTDFTVGGTTMYPYFCVAV